MEQLITPEENKFSEYEYEGSIAASSDLEFFVNHKLNNEETTSGEDNNKHNTNKNEERDHDRFSI